MMTQSRFRFLSALVLCLWSLWAWAQEGAFPLRDEAVRDDTLLAFRERLMQVVAVRDAEFVAAVLDRQVAVGGGRYGPQAFVERWRPEAVDSPLWTELAAILPLGGAFVRSERGVLFCAPYVFTHFPAELDPYGTAAVVRPAQLREGPGEGGVLASLDQVLVKVQDWRSRGEGWIAVETFDGRSGYLPRSALRSPTDARLCLLKRRDAWRIRVLAADE